MRHQCHTMMMGVETDAERGKIKMKIVNNYKLIRDDVKSSRH